VSPPTLKAYHQPGADAPVAPTMTVPLLTLMVLIAAFAGEVGWLCWC
jgi:hypothetical protein